MQKKKKRQFHSIIAGKLEERVFFSFYHSDPILKSVDNLKVSPEDIAGVPVEVSIGKPMNVTVFTSFYLRELL